MIPGGPAITVSGTRLSLDPSATALVAGSSTLTLLPTITPGFPSTIILGTDTLTANSAGEFIFGGHTLGPGGSAMTVDGVVLSLPSQTLPDTSTNVPKTDLAVWILQGLAGALHKDSSEATTAGLTIGGDTLQATKTVSVTVPVTKKSEGSCIGMALWNLGIVMVVSYAMGM
jgi:hypothetical protein